MENKEKLVVCVMGQNCEKFIGMALESVKDADSVVYCDGGGKDKFWKRISFPLNIETIENKYDQEDKQMNGKQRNFYLDYVKNNYPDHWCLALDADEIVEDISKIKEFIQEAQSGVYSVKMRHLIGNLGQEDATRPVHFALHRLFKVDSVNKYPLQEHPVLIPKKNVAIGTLVATTLWHLGYIHGMFDIKRKYDNHSNKSQIHTPEYLKNWYYSHLFGKYPSKPVNSIELPKILLDNFHVDKDEIYFANRGLELKHFLMAKQWRDYFKYHLLKSHDAATFSILDLGAGRGAFGYAFDMMKEDYVGIEISEYAVKNKLCEFLGKGDILEYVDYPEKDLVLAIDVLEHLEYKDLDKAITKMISSCYKYILVSIPFVGNPNLEVDPTHIIKESKEWWIKQFTNKKLKLINTPNNFLFKEQILIFEKGEKDD